MRAPAAAHLSVLLVNECYQQWTQHHEGVQPQHMSLLRAVTRCWQQLQVVCTAEAGTARAFPSAHWATGVQLCQAVEPMVPVDKTPEPATQQQQQQQWWTEPYFGSWILPCYNHLQLKRSCIHQQGTAEDAAVHYWPPHHPSAGRMSLTCCRLTSPCTPVACTCTLHAAPDSHGSSWTTSPIHH